MDGTRLVFLLQGEFVCHVMNVEYFFCVYLLHCMFLEDSSFNYPFNSFHLFLFSMYGWGKREAKIQSRGSLVVDSCYGLCLMVHRYEESCAKTLKRSRKSATLSNYLLYTPVYWYSI